VAVMVRGYDLETQLCELERNHPELHAVIDPQRLSTWRDELAHRSEMQDDFGPSGRGVEYLQAQELNVNARAVGITQLAQLMLGRPGANPARDRIIVDLLGGNGLVRRVISATLGPRAASVLTCDASPHMVSAAWAQGAPAIIQRAEQSLLRSGSVDGVLLAYGSHHIPVGLRQTVANEAYRVLRPGGIFVLHDFLHGSPAERWFADVAHPYSLTGHDFEHFTYREIKDCIARAGFVTSSVMDLDDSYTVTGATADEARRNMGQYLVKMYGLVRVERELGTDAAYYWAADQARQIFRYADDGVTAKASRLCYDDRERTWYLTIPRRAVVGIGWK